MYADSSRGFYSPWMRDTVIDSPITAVCSGTPTKNYFSELNAAFYLKSIGKPVINKHFLKIGRSEK
jgi:hypothetical protein